MTAVTVRCGYVSCFGVAPPLKTRRFYTPDQKLPCTGPRQELIGSCRSAPCWPPRAAPTIGRDGTDRKRIDADDDRRAPPDPSPDALPPKAVRRPVPRFVGGDGRAGWRPVALGPTSDHGRGRRRSRRAVRGRGPRDEARRRDGWGAGTPEPPTH